MFKQILIPLDGSPLAQCALPAAFGLATAFDSEVDFIHVLGEQGADTTSQVDPLLWHMRKAEIESYLSSIAQAFSKHNLQCRQTILEGAVAERIVAHAAAQDVDLIVLSSHGNSGLSGWNVSSVAQKITMRANRSVMLIRAFQQPPPTQQEIEPLRFQRLLVPLDGSRRAECILPAANKLAVAHNATVWLAHVVTPASLLAPFQDPNEAAPAPLADITDQYEQAAVGYLQHVQSQMECTIKTVVLQGDAVISTLNHFAEQESIDLMLFCAHGRSNTSHSYGSIVTSSVVHGDTSLFVFQDLTPGEIRPTGAEIAASQQTNVDSLRANRHAQPAFWTH